MSQQESHQSCKCSGEGFFITNRQASMISSLLILLFMMTFISGYFWGHGKATQEFTEKLIDDSFTDKINYAFYSNFDKTPTDPETEAGEEDFEEVEPDARHVFVKESDKQDDKADDTKDPQQNEIGLSQSDTLYYAELIGFGTMAAAKQFIERALQRGYNIDIRQRASKTAKGKLIYWFQAVTEKFGNKDELIDLVTRIQKSEKIKDIKIVEEKNNIKG